MNHQDTKDGSTKAIAAEDPKGTDRSMTIYVLWGVGLGLLLMLGLVCWLVVAPALEVRAALNQQYERPTMSAPFPDVDVEKCVNAVTRLGGPEAAARKLHLYLLLPKRSDPHRYRAALLLRLCGRAAGPDLIKLLKDRDVMVRHEAAQGLGAVAPRDAVEPLIAIVENAGEDANVRVTAAWSLALIGDPRALPALKAAAEGKESYVAIYAAQARTELQKAARGKPQGAE